MNGLEMRVDRNERARFPEFEQSLLTSGPATEWTACAARPEWSGHAGGSTAARVRACWDGALRVSLL
jgi:hypothetical protein